MWGCRHFVTLRVTLPRVTYWGLASSSRLSCQLFLHIYATVLRMQLLPTSSFYSVFKCIWERLAGWHQKWNSGLRQMCPPPNLSFLGYQICLPQRCCPFSSHTWLAGGQRSHGRVKELTSSLWFFIIWNIMAILISMFMDRETASVHYWSMTPPCLLCLFQDDLWPELI